MSKYTLEPIADEVAPQGYILEPIEDEPIETPERYDTSRSEADNAIMFKKIRDGASLDAEKKAKNSMSLAAAYDMKSSSAYSLHDEFVKQTKESNLYDKAVGSFKAGWGDVYSSIGGMMKRKDFLPDRGQDYLDFGNRLKLAYIPPTDQSEFTWRKMKDPEWYATTMTRAVPFTLSLIPAAIIGAYGASVAAGAFGLGAFGTYVVAALGGAALARPIESSFEAQGAYDEAIGKGKTPEEAEEAADRVFWGNMKLVGLDAAEFATAFVPMGKIAGAGAKRVLLKRIAASTGKLGAVGIMEAGEERYQEKLVLDALDDPTSFFDFSDPRLNEASAAGAVFGVGLGGTGSVWNALTGKMKKNMPEATRKIYETTKKNNRGLGGDQAELKALDAIAETLEGKEHIKTIITEMKDLAEGKEVKAKEAGEPFILGVNEDQNGETISFTMADPVTGETFEVDAIKSSEGTDETKIRFAPDPMGIAEGLRAIREKGKPGDIDTQIDKLVEGDEVESKAIMGELFKEEALSITTPLEPKEKVLFGKELEAKGERVLAELRAAQAGEQALLGEARKYESAEEFVRENPDETGSFLAKNLKWQETIPGADWAKPTEGRKFAKYGNWIIEDNSLYKDAPAGAKVQYHIHNTKGEVVTAETTVEKAMAKIEKWGGITKSQLTDFVNKAQEGVESLTERAARVRKETVDKFAEEAASTETITEREIRRKAQEGKERIDQKTIADKVKKINDDIGEKGTVDLEPIIDLGKVIWNEGNQKIETFTARAKELLGDVWDKVKDYIKKAWEAVKAFNEILGERGSFSTEFKKEAEIARKAFAEGRKIGIEESKEKLRWMISRRETLQNIRDYFKLTDSELKQITRKNPLLMKDADFSQFMRDVQEKAVLLRDNKQAKIELMMLIEDRRLQKVDNYRKAMEYPPISQMTTTQLREFADLLEPFQEDDIFLTQRELETVDRTDLKGIRTWREARERLSAETGVSVEELSKIKVATLDNFRWDSALRERDPFYDMLVTKMTEAIVGAELRYHNIETEAFRLANKSNKSISRSLIERMIPQDEQIIAFLEATAEEKNIMAPDMTEAQLDYAHYIGQYFEKALDYLIATKAVSKGRENYFVHIRKTFLETVKNDGFIKAVSGIFKQYQEDQIGFNILDDNTGNILPLEKFFQFALHRTGELDPTKNVTRAFLTYVRTFERKKMFDAIMPKLDIYTQSLTPTKYTARGLEIDTSLKRFVNKYINNKKGRKISYDSVIRQGGPLDVGIRAIRTFTTMMDLGFSIPVGVASFVGEQVATFEMLGVAGITKGTVRMRLDKGKRILKEYQSFTDRGFWENFTAPGKQVVERITESMFGLFQVSTVTANKQFLLGSLTDAEWESETVSEERLAEMRLERGRFRVVPGSNSLVGSTSIGNAAVQYKTWAVPIIRTLTHDMASFAKDLKNKPIGESLTTREAKELYRLIGLTTAVVIVGSMAGADKDDRTFLGKLKSRVYREATTLTQGIDPRLWLATPRILTWLAKIGEALSSIVQLETYKTKPGLKGVDTLKKQFTPGAIRSLGDKKKGQRNDNSKRN